MKKSPKIIKKVLSCVFGLCLCALSILAPFSGLKKASAEYALPPSDVVGDGDPYISSFYGANIGLSFGVPSIGSSFEMSLSLPFLYDSGVGDTVYNFDLYSNTSEYIIRTRSSIVLPYSFSYYFDVSEFDFRNSTVYFNYEFLNGIMYLNSELYSLFFSNLYLQFGTNVSINNPWALLIGSVRFVSSSADGLSHQTFPVVFTNSFERLRGTISFPSWGELTDEGLVNDDGYVALSHCNILLSAVVSSVQDNFTYVITRNSEPFLASEFNSIQSMGFSSFAPYVYYKVPVDDIGLNTIGTAVTSFLNMEFVPDFKLWYFLLIGLGCAIVGIGLKFFFGG